MTLSTQNFPEKSFFSGELQWELQLSLQDMRDEFALLITAHPRTRNFLVGKNCRTNQSERLC